MFVVPGQGAGTAPYLPLWRALEDAGHEVRVLDLAGVDLRADAAAIGEAVAAEYAADPRIRLSLVGYSLGGLSARVYLKSGGGAGIISGYVAVGTSQYGNRGACREGATAPEACVESDFIAELNAGVDTPGEVGYYSVRSSGQWSDGRLDGGQCRMAPVDPPPGLDGGTHHFVESLDPRMTEQVIRALAGGCPGEWVFEPDGAITAADTFVPEAPGVAGPGPVPLPGAPREQSTVARPSA